ncbi:MAG: ATP-binding cassette domain-containing protein [bacterium]|nr:ATP-binding cassette domain-containing protein [bacterium]
MKALDASLLIRVADERSEFAVESELSLDHGVLVMFGPSGAGKSLTLQGLAGLIPAESGFIRVGEETLFDSRAGVNLPAYRRRIGYVPQQDSLLPFCDVAMNIAFGLPRSERRRDNPKLEGLLQEFGLAKLARARPKSLSGGERKRVALARALAVEPRLLLLDEPFASIDQSGREQLYGILRETLREHATPAVIVTHDAREGASLGDHVVRFERGRTVATGSPAEMLPHGQPIRLSGRRRAAPQVLSDGRVRVELDSVTLEVSAALLDADEQEIELNLRDQAHSTSDGPEEE